MKEHQQRQKGEIIDMKKMFLVLLFIIVAVISNLIYTDFSFSPLKEKEFKKLFKGYIGDPNKFCSKDFLGVSSKGELFDIYLYNTNNAIIDKDFPKIDEWGNKKITKESFICKWKNCPLDSQTMELYKFTLASNNLDEVKCSNTFNKEILNSKNYFSYIHFNELEQYFLLYCTDKQELYYIRRKGF